jgi:hypothetical protein
VFDEILARNSGKNLERTKQLATESLTNDQMNPG